MTPSPRRRITLLGALVGLAGAACFDGDAAEGLPCELDEDCGIGTECIEGVCGGVPAGTTTPTTTITPTTTQTTTGPMTTEDTGTTASPSMCGDGNVDPGEECDPGASPTDCTPICTVAACGDGYASPIEACDDSETNPDGVDSDVDDCTRQCRATAFWDDMELEQVSEREKWIRETDPAAWAGWDARDGRWHSGAYEADGGSATLRTIDVALPTLEQAEIDAGSRIELRLSHAYAFEPDCGAAGPPDGGVIRVRVDGDSQDIPPVQPSGYPDVLAPQMGCTEIMQDPNPLGGSPGFGGIEPGEDVRVDLTGFAGQTISIELVVGYDCGNCGAPADDAWSIDDVVIARFDP